jgi:hypothetical protein
MLYILPSAALFLLAAWIVVDHILDSLMKLKFEREQLMDLLKEAKEIIEDMASSPRSCRGKKTSLHMREDKIARLLKFARSSEVRRALGDISFDDILGEAA